MNNIAIIFAGGIGSRMGDEVDKPKQFLEIDSKPILIHTIEKFEKCSQIDAISVACKKEYIEHFKKLINNYNIKKVRWIVPGGSTGQLSIFNALDVVFKDDNFSNKNKLVLIHDGVRPIINNKLIIDNINTAREYGNAITVVPATETIFKSKDDTLIDDVLQRDELYYARAPQTFFLKDIYKFHLKEMNNNNFNNIDSCSLMHKYDIDLNFVKGKSSNIKITTFEDFLICKALYKHRK